MPTFEQRDPTLPGFWDERFAREFTPWDMGGVPAALRQFVERHPAPRHGLIPGCGAAHELAYLCEAGWDALAIDFSGAAVTAARNQAGHWAARVHQADFFSFVPPHPVDFIYERAFLCALPAVMRARVVSRWADLLSAGGLLAGFFYFDGAGKGPPFGMEPGELAALMSPCFEKVDEQPVPDSIPVFAGKERWQVWKRTSLPD
jgi:hypothetical protein